MSKQHTDAEIHGTLHAIAQEHVTGIRSNSTSGIDQNIRSRMGAMLSGGYDFADTLHNIYLDYGYPAVVTFFNLWNMYRRFGVARRAVELYPEQTWLDDPIIESTNKEFMRDLKVLAGTKEDGTVDSNSVGLWRRMRGLDTRQRVGRYAGMFMRVRDGLQPHQEIAGKLSGLNSLVEMMPLYESQLKVLSTETDPESENFGQPIMYQFNSTAPGNRNDRQATSFEIHPSRIVISAEGSDNGGIYGVPILESVYNDLMDLRKTLGGGAEGFYKNAAQSILFDLKDASSATSNKTLLDAFSKNYDDFAQNRSRRAMWTPGMEAKTLDSALTNSEPFYNGSLLAISAGVDIPIALLVGNQTGRLAGDQDTKAFLGQVQARRNDFGTDSIVTVLDWLMRWGILPAAPYSVEWPDAQAPSQEQKLSNADKMADINKKAFESGGDIPFSGEEIREAAGHDKEEMPEADNVEDDDDIDDDTIPSDES